MNGEDKPWLKAWPKYLAPTIDYPQVPLQGLLEDTARRYPQRVALLCQKQEITYTQLDSLSNQFANALSQLGLAKGDRVALFMPNIAQFAIAFFGALKAGAVVVAISPLHREREVEFQLSDSGAKVIVALDTLYPIVAKVSERTQIEHVILTSSEHLHSQAPSPAMSLHDLLGLASESSSNVEFNLAQDLAALQYTGGTTGTPKAAMLTHRNLVSNALAFAATIQGTSQDVFLTALPLSHIYGLTTSLTAPVSVGAGMVLMPKFTPAGACKAIQQHRVSVFCGVPTMYQILLAAPDLARYDLSSLRVCISGASSLPPQVQRRFMEATGGLLAEGYGLTEASPVTHCSPVDKSVPLRVGSIGLPLPDTEACIVDAETGQKTLGVGEEGELAVKGPQVMLGYWQNPQETAAVLRGGWLLTGDIARMDTDGYFYIVDRKKDLIKHKGYSIYPRELEDVLYEHPAVKLCAVVGKADAEAGEVPKAFVVLREGAWVSAEELMAFVNGKVARYKAIREVEFQKELPISSAGKVLRRQLRD